MLKPKIEFSVYCYTYVWISNVTLELLQKKLEFVVYIQSAGLENKYLMWHVLFIGHKECIPELLASK